MLPRLRTDLDFFPSPVPDRPGLVIRDPFQYCDSTLIVPPALVACLAFFDGERSELDLREYLLNLTGDLAAVGLQQHLMDTLSEAGLLEDEAFVRHKQEAERAFAAALVREAAHAGSGYPAEAGPLAETLRGYLAREQEAPLAQDGRILAIAAPHVSPFGGVDAYRAAYSSLRPEDAERTFVILGTSHYGHPDRIGLTRKPFITPLGESITDTSLVEELLRGAGDAAAIEDYCHSFEHSIEFQVVFLQHLFGPRIRIVPVLCGSYARSLFRGGLPDKDERIHKMLDAFGEFAAR